MTQTRRADDPVLRRRPDAIRTGTLDARAGLLDEQPGPAGHRSWIACRSCGARVEHAWQAAALGRPDEPSAACAGV